MPDYPERRLTIHEIPAQSEEEVLLKSKIIVNDLVCCELGSMMANRIMRDNPDDYQKFLILIDLEQVNAGLDKVYGTLSSGQLNEDFKEHRKGALVIKTAKMGDISKPIFTWLIEDI